jgi:hypothetical protein
MKNIVLLMVFAFLMTAMATSIIDAQTTEPTKPDDAVVRQAWSAGPKLAPFQALRWREQVAEVRVNGTWYELLGVNDLPADQIISFAQSVDERNWQKRIEEDLPAVLILMGHPPGPAVKLSLKNLESGTQQTLDNVQMTEKNRQLIQTARRTASEPTTQPGTTGL